jgi:plastocyanin
MTRRLTVAICATAALGTSIAALAGSAGAAAPEKSSITITGGVNFNAGKSVVDAQRFGPAILTVRSGSTVIVKNRSRTQDPHTLSLVTKRGLPTGFSAKGCPQCGPLMQAHQADQQTGQVGVPLVDVGAAGFDRPGDSQFIPPKRGISFKVTAKKGTTLYYFCVVHPWMQGEIKVS